MSTCTTCGDTLREGARFCGSCGTAQAPASGDAWPVTGPETVALPGPGAPPPTYPGPAPIGPAGPPPMPPGYAVPAPGQGGPPPAGGGRKTLLLVAGAVGAVLVLVVGAVVALRVLGGDDGSPEVVVSQFNYPVTEAGPTGAPDEEADWETDVDCEEICSVTADGDRVYVSRSEGTDTEEGGDLEVTAYHAGSGEKVWDAPVRLDGGGSVGVVDGRLLVGGSDTSSLVDPKSGDELWEVKGAFTSLVGDLMLTVEYDDDGESSTTRVVEMSSGQVLWDTEDGLLPCGALLLAGDANDEEDLRRVEPRSGEEIWSGRIEGAGDEEVSTGFSCNDEVLAYNSAADEVTVLSMDDGKEIGTIDVDEGASSTVLVEGDDVVLAGGGDVALYQRAGDGYEERWSVDGPDDAANAFVLDGDLVVIEYSTRASVFDLGDGSKKGSASISDDERTQLTTASLLLFDTERVEALELATMDSRWSLDIDDDVSDVAAGGSRLFTVTADTLSSFS